MIEFVEEGAKLEIRKMLFENIVPKEEKIFDNSELAEKYLELLMKKFDI